MIATLAGVVARSEEKSLILEVGGVGYRVAVAASVSRKARAGVELSLWIHHHVSAEAEELFGFVTESDLRHFDLLLTVPSVGPRTALNILDVAPPDVLAQAVAAGDVKLLTKVSGVGKKTAERILVELKEKFKDVEVTGPLGDVQEETLSALVNLGYTQTRARAVVRSLPDDISTVEEAVKVVLQSQGAQQ